MKNHFDSIGINYYLNVFMTTACCTFFHFLYILFTEQVNNLREIQALRRLSPNEHIVTLYEVL